MITKLGIVRTIGWIQLVASVFLAIGITSTYFAYRSSLADSSRVLAASILSVSDTLIYSSEKIAAPKDLLEDVKKALKTSRALVEKLKISAEIQGKNIPQYAGYVKKTAIAVGGIGSALNAVGNRVRLQKIPHMTLRPPAIGWTTPWEDQGKELQANGQAISELSGNLAGAADSMVTDLPKWNAALIDTSQKTLELLVNMEGASNRLGPETLSKMVEGLKATAQNLRQVSDLASKAESWGFVLFATCFFLALLLGLNSMAMLLLAPPPTKE